MAEYLGQRTRVEFNGHDVSHLTGCTIGTMNPVFDTFQSLKDPYDHDIEITEEATGTFDFVGSDKSGDQRFKEIFKQVTGFVDLDYTSTPTTDTLTMTDEDFTNPDTQGSYTGSRFLTSFTQLADGDANIVMESVNETVWFKIVAMGETITNLALPFKTSGGTNAQMEARLYINNSGKPHASTKANSDTAAPIDFTLENADFGSAFRWANLTVPATWTNLTIGETYWVRVKFEVENGSGVDPNLRVRTTLPLSNNASTFNADSTSVPASATANTEVIHYIKYKSTEGLNVVVYDYADLAETTGVKYTFNKVKLDSVIPSFADKQASRSSVSWKCNDYSYDTI